MVKLSREIQSAIAKEKKIAIELFTISDDVEKFLEHLIRKILEKYERTDLVELIYTCLKEIVINGSKANVKRILFEEHQIELATMADHDKGLSIFKERLSERFMEEYGEKALNRDLHVKVKMDFNSYRFIIIVANNVPTYTIEDMRIRQKFKNAMSYDDIVQFYLEHGDDTEGAGLGITLNTMLLKNADFDPHLFTIYSYNNETRSKLEIPFNDEYKTSRQRYREKFEIEN